RRGGRLWASHRLALLERDTTGASILRLSAFICTTFPVPSSPSVVNPSPQAPVSAMHSNSSGRRWMLRIALAVAAPLVVVGGLELVLRLVGFGQPTSFFIRDESAPGLYRTNPHFTQTFFPASFGLKPANFRLPKEKPADTFRVFVLGESAAMGIPEPGFGLAPLLEAQLADAAGGRTVQVHNLAVTAINSHVVRCIAEEALEFEPDLLVLYMGNNEVVGPYGP